MGVLKVLSLLSEQGKLAYEQSRRLKWFVITFHGYVGMK